MNTMSSATQQYSPSAYSTSYSSSSSTYSSTSTGMTRFSQNHVSSSSGNVSPSKKYGRSDSGSDLWQKNELDFRSRRSVSPSAPSVAQPGWNETSQSNTSTWPLKLKQPSPPASSPLSVSPPKTSPTTSPTSNYVTTLEARVEGSGSTIPVRHKIINVGPPTQEERILQSLRASSRIQESEQKRLLSQQQPLGTPVRSVTMGGSNVVTSPSVSSNSNTRQTPKYSISVTVDVDQAKSNEMDNSLVARNRQQSSGSNEVSQLSAIDYAKVRFHEAQQHPKTAVRLQDERNLGSRPGSVGNDGRVLNTRNRFEPGEGVIRPFDPILSTLPEFYRRKLRKMQRKSGSPEPLAGVLATLPHPELTDQQKAHIRERSQSPSAAAAAIRPFLTQGSVAERVMIFERAPVEMKPKPPSDLAHLSQERRKPGLPYRDPDSVRSKAQVRYYSSDVSSV